MLAINQRANGSKPILFLLEGYDRHNDPDTYKNDRINVCKKVPFAVSLRIFPCKYEIDFSDRSS